MAVVEISIVPLGIQGTSLSSYVARALKVLGRSRLRYELTGMGTIISGDLDEIWSVLREMHESCFAGEANRVLTTIRIDDRRDRESTSELKVQSVMEKLADDR
ncbi:MAG: MTH1187 family thiamine-binding protein [Syntrophobacteraceae bacterium]|jgi:uncharacterized protein (TIGR00106 family)|nr:MTH1187 family thiamine-binding protein [Syntrophobacteraceae bacterium]